MHAAAVIREVILKYPALQEQPLELAGKALLALQVKHNNA